MTRAARSLVDKLLAAVSAHERWRGSECINLIPSETLTSDLVRRLLSTDLVNRYTSSEGFYAGTRFIDEVESLGEEVARRLFGAEYASLRPISGHIADMIFLMSHTRPGDRIACVSPDNGGYPGISHRAVAPLLGLENVYLPFDRKRFNIVAEEAAEVIRRKKPRAVILGASFILFPHPVRELAETAREVGAAVCYDGSHVLGLIAGGKFQDPLREGASVLLGSTHKSFFGPQGGIILANGEAAERIEKVIFPSLVDNAHWNRIAALTAALIEMEEFGRDYAAQVVRNSKALAKALSELGEPVIGRACGFTESHQVILGVGELGAGHEVAEKLERANIIVDRGVRLGTSEVTRLGMKEGEMEQMAHMIHEVLSGRREPEEVAEEVKKLRREFTTCMYCFEHGV